jgi:hypothetical protein
MNNLPLEYHIEVYEETFINDPSIAWSASTPYPTVSVGDFFEHRGFDRWYNTPKKGERFKVKEIEHIFWEIEGDHVGHKLMVCLEVVTSEKA